MEGGCGAGEWLCSESGAAVRVPLVEELARLVDAYAAGTHTPPLPLSHPHHHLHQNLLSHLPSDKNSLTNTESTN